MTPKQTWCEQVAPQRRVMGTLVSRTVESKRYVTAPPTLPDGQYVIVQYKTVFEKKKAATEMVVVALEDDGVWRVVAYLIQ